MGCVYDVTSNTSGSVVVAAQSGLYHMDVQGECQNLLEIGKVHKHEVFEINLDNSFVQWSLKYVSKWYVKL